MNLIPKRKQNSTQALGDNISQSTLDQIVNMTIKRIADGVVTTAKIADLAVTNAKINDLSVTKLTAGNLTVAATIGTGGAIQSAASGTRIQITPDEIAGYNGTTKQFYILSSDGKGYFGAGGCILDVLGLTIDNATIITAALRFTNGSGVLSTIYQYAASGGGGNLAIQADGYLLLGSDLALVKSNCGFAPSAAGSFDFGTTGLYWNNIFYKVLSDQGCPAPLINSLWNTFKNIKTKKRELTLEDVEREDMGSRALARVKSNPGVEFEELDFSSYPEELLVIPTDKDYEEANKLYESDVAKAKENKENWKKVKKYEPKIGLCTNELVYTQTKIIQELMDKVEKLETEVYQNT